MGRNWAGNYDRRHRATYSIDAGTILARLGREDGSMSLLVGDHLVIRLSPTGALRVVRLLQAAGS
jgi:hypothetical protein